MAIHSETVSIPPRQKFLIQPAEGNWKVTAIAVNGPSFHMYFAGLDYQGQTINTEFVISDGANLKTELYLTPDHFMVFDNDSSRTLSGFFSAIDC